MNKYKYFLLSAGLILADQISKLLVIKNIALYEVAWSFGGDFFRLIHVRNEGVAFSMGAGFPDFLRKALFIVLPVVILVGIIVYILRSKDLSEDQKWVLAGILGGGFGNQIDRIFRPEGVVDFLDFKFYGIFGLERWPTFNIADSSLVVCSAMLIILLIVQEVHLRKEQKS